MTQNIPRNRSDFYDFETCTTRWMDNDAYGHMNNVIHYSLIDTAVTNWQRERGFFDQSATKFFVVESGCKYFDQAKYPDIIHLGLGISHIGRTSWRYEVGLFKNNDKQSFAHGFFAQVQVDAETERPRAIEPDLREILTSILIKPAQD